MTDMTEISIRVRYSETDAMGFLHHANYFNYFEMGRVELLRKQGGDYRRMEESGFYFVVADIQCRYRKPARYDDLLMLRTALKESSAAKLLHNYTLLREEEVIAEGTSRLVCINKEGRVSQIPESLFDSGAG